MGEADRLTRVNELLKREIADNLEKCLLFSGNGALVSVTEVKTSVDLRNATVFVSIFVPKNGSKIEVDYTFKKHVKKPPKSKPGSVIYTDYKTIIVNPNSHEELIVK